MNARFLLLYGILSFALASGAEHLSPADQKVVDVMGLSITSDLSILGSDRPAVVERLRQIASGQIDHIGTSSLSADNAQIVLIRLGDDQTIQQVMKQYHQYNSRYAVAHIPDMLEWSKQPAVIPYLAPDFFMEEDASQSVNLQEGPGETVGVAMISIYSGVIVLEIIKRSPEFGPEMKTWAKEAYALRLKSPGEFRKLMRDWWNLNKDAFALKKYEAVKPLPLTGKGP